MQILIADNNKVLGELIEYYCISLDYETRLVDNGRDALLELKSRDYDLLIADILLPYHTGLELLDHLNDGEGASNPGKILLTRINNEKTVKKAFELGIDDYFVKPVDLDFLMRRIQKLLENA